MTDVTKPLIIFASTALGVLGAACSKPDASAIGPSKATASPAAAGTTGVRASCDAIAKGSFCREYTQPAFFLGERYLKDGCEVHGTFRTGSVCPAEGVLGTCELPSKANGEGFPGETRKYYSVGGVPFTAATAEKDCVGDKGKWVPK